MSHYGEVDFNSKFPDPKLLGNWLLAAPVVANQASHDVHVPEGNWFDVATRRVVKGPADLIRYPADLTQTATFIRRSTRDTGILMRSLAPGASQRPAP